MPSWCRLRPPFQRKASVLRPAVVRNRGRKQQSLKGQTRLRGPAGKQKREVNKEKLRRTPQPCSPIKVSRPQRSSSRPRSDSCRCQGPQLDPRSSAINYLYVLTWPLGIAIPKATESDSSGPESRSHQDSGSQGLGLPVRRQESFRGAGRAERSRPGWSELRPAPRLPRRRGSLLRGHPTRPSLPIAGPAAAAPPAHGPQRGRTGRGGGAPVWSIDPTSPPAAGPDWAGLPALAPARGWPGSRRGHTPLLWPCSAGSNSYSASARPARSFPASLAVAQGQGDDQGVSFITSRSPSDYPLLQASSSAR